MNIRFGRAVSVILLLIVSLALPVWAAVNEQPISLTINGGDAPYAAAPIEQDGSVLLPARAFLELVGGQVAWDPAPPQTLSVIYGQLTAKVGRDSTTVISLEGDSTISRTTELPSPMRLIGGRAYLPLSFFTLVLGIPTEYLNETRQVTVRIIDGKVAPSDNPANEAKIALAFLWMSPGERARLLTAFPKGGDLHNHLSGAIFPEEYIAIAKNDPSLCLDPTSLQAIACAPSVGVRFSDLTYPLTDRLIDLWTMRGVDPATEKPYAHFFATFSDFGQIAQDHTPDMLTTAAATAYRNNIQHLELMLSLDSTASVKAIADQLGPWDDTKLEANYQKIKTDPIMTAMLNAARTKLDVWDAHRGCPDATKDYCKVSVRYIQQLKRESDTNWQFFVQLVFGMELQAQDSRVVGLNPVQIEYGQKALDNFADQINMLYFIHNRYPAQHISLHGGELNPDVLKEAKGHDDDLAFHVAASASTGAERIGHAASILWEPNMRDTLKRMASTPVAVEINLTSNEYILSMGTKKGYNTYTHPLRTYLASGVPVVLSTDDAGVERTNLSTEYYRAATDYHVDYYGLKQISRNSLIFSFLPGKSLWVTPNYKLVPECINDIPGADDPSSTCKSFLSSSEKARLQWQLEAAFTSFEANEVKLLPKN